MFWNEENKKTSSDETTTNQDEASIRKRRVLIDVVCIRQKSFECKGMVNAPKGPNQYYCAILYTVSLHPFLLSEDTSDY